MTLSQTDCRCWRDENETTRVMQKSQDACGVLKRSTNGGVVVCPLLFAVLPHLFSWQLDIIRNSHIVYVYRYVLCPERNLNFHALFYCQCRTRITIINSNTATTDAIASGNALPTCLSSSYLFPAFTVAALSFWLGREGDKSRIW